MVFRTLVTRVGSKRVPLIKFRNGANAHAAASSASSGTNQASSTPSSSGVPQYSSSAIEDWELPLRFMRKPISAEEMEYINRGGPA